MYSTFLKTITAYKPINIPALLLTVALFLLLLFLPYPDSIQKEGQILTAIFISTIFGIIVKVTSIGAMSLIGMLTMILLMPGNSKTNVNMALSGFSNSLIWLIAISIMVSRALQKTPLGARLGFIFIAIFGKTTIGIGYALAICETILAPVMPSNTARGGGVLHPIMKSIAYAFDSTPEKGTQNKIGTYLSLVNYHANPITSTMFVTATAPNPLVVSYIAQATNNSWSLSWGEWTLYIFLPAFTALLLMPLIIYHLNPPEIKQTPDAPLFAHSKLKELGALNIQEKILIGAFAVMLVFWSGFPGKFFSIFELTSLASAFTLDATATAILGLTLLLLTGVLNWDDILSEKSAWDSLFWFSVLVMMATGLNKFGVISVFSNWLSTTIVALGMHWLLAAGLLILVFLYSHYAFASTTAHISAMMLTFLTVGIALVPSEYMKIFILSLTMSSTIMMGLTHYATGTSPIIFGSGYVTLSSWLKVGFIMSVANLVIMVTVGLAWWKLLGAW